MLPSIKNNTILSLSWLLFWVFLGFFSLFLHNLILPYIYLILAAITAASLLYIVCRRCSYFGRECHLLGGIAASRIWNKETREKTEKDEIISSILTVSLVLFPVPFLLYYLDWAFLFLYLLASLGWFVYRKNFVCIKCRNKTCKLFK
jgi:hypothetical protein